MDENEVVETQETEAEWEEADTDAWGAGWDDDSDFDTDDSAITDDEGSDDHEDAQPDGTTEEEAEEADSETEEPGTETEEGNQLFTIKYLGNEERLTLEEITELAQKGRDYDHVREERDSLKSETGRQLAFLKDLADRAGLSVDEQIDKTRALWLMNEEFDKGNEISETEALLRVQREKKNSPQKESPEPTDEEDYSPQIDRFLAVYPDVQATDIPQEVWNRARELGGDLLSAYQAYEIQRLKSENAKKRQEDRNTKNKERSTGSRKSAGAAKQRDDFDEGWYSE